jgi:hypothetical protein
MDILKHDPQNWRYSETSFPKLEVFSNLFSKNWRESETHPPKLEIFSNDFPKTDDILQHQPQRQDILQQTPRPLVRKRTIPTERSPLAGEI